MFVYLVETAVNTGFIFFPLLIIGIVGWYYTFSITLFLWKEKRLNRGNGEELSFFQGLLVLLQSGEPRFKEAPNTAINAEGNLNTTLTKGQNHRNGTLQKVATLGFVTFGGKNYNSMEASVAIQTVLLEAKVAVEVRQRFAAHRLGGVKKAIATVYILAGVAPLLGLLGTVTGMIDTFEVISVYGNANPTLLAEGISKALLTTQFGLAVALPLLLASLSMGSKVKRLNRRLRKAG